MPIFDTNSSGGGGGGGGGTDPQDRLVNDFAIFKLGNDSDMGIGQVMLTIPDGTPGGESFEAGYNAPGRMGIYSNVGEDGSGDWSPGITMNPDFMELFAQGGYFVLRTGNAAVELHGDNITSQRQIRFPDRTGYLVSATADVNLAVNGKGFVNHGSNANVTRPEGFASIEWYGSVEPNNSIDGDTWINTAV